MTHNILIVGGTGSLGSELTRFYHNKGWKVTVFSRDGHKQQALGMELPDVNFVLGDICDKDAIKFAVDGQEYVINAAAQKIVSQGEVFVEEFIRVNLLGAMNVVQQCYDADIYNVLQISSDKAVEPVNLYGKTKAVAEDVFRSFGYCSLRYGNVCNSRGAVYEIWKDQLVRGESITVRTPYSTRFVLTLKDAVALVDDALKYIHLNTIFVPHSLKAVYIDDVARALGVTNWVEKPLLSGEKVHEKLVSDNETGFTISPLLMSVNKEGNGNLHHRDFCSETAPRITGEEFLKIVEGN